MNDRSGGDLGAVFGILRRRLWIVVLTIIAFAGAAYGYSELQDEEYEGTSVLLFRPLLLDAQLTGLPLQAQGDADREAETNVRLVSLDTIRRRVAQRIGGTTTASGLEDQVTITADGQSSLVSITATAGNAELAARIADLMATEFVTFRRDSVRFQVQQAADRVRSELERQTDAPQAVRVALRRNIERLELLRSVQTGDASVVQRATVPDDPSAPLPKRNAAIGGFAGLLVGLALALVLEQLDRRTRRAEDLIDVLDAPLLGTVPRSRRLRLRKADRPLPEREAEVFRHLRTLLRWREGDELQRLLVTSAGVDSGKSTIALHLARAAASGGARVLLLEADMRRPTIGRALGLDSPGLAAVLQGDERPGGTIPARTIDGTSLDVLPAGTAAVPVADLLDSPRLGEVLREVAETYDLVIIDGPPFGAVADAIPLARNADGVLLVVRLGHESHDDVRRVSTELTSFGARIIGFVANFARERPDPYGYAGKR